MRSRNSSSLQIVFCRFGTCRQIGRLLEHHNSLSTWWRDIWHFLEFKRRAVLAPSRTLFPLVRASERGRGLQPDALQSQRHHQQSHSCLPTYIYSSRVSRPAHHTTPLQPTQPCSSHGSRFSNALAEAAAAAEALCVQQHTAAGGRSPALPPSCSQQRQQRQHHQQQQQQQQCRSPRVGCSRGSASCARQRQRSRWLSPCHAQASSSQKQKSRRSSSGTT